MLGVSGAGDSKGRVELFERGYGKDAAGIAREAIHYGMKTPSHICLSGLSSFFFFLSPG